MKKMYKEVLDFKTDQNKMLYWLTYSKRTRKYRINCNYLGFSKDFETELDAREYFNKKC